MDHANKNKEGSDNPNRETKEKMIYMWIADKKFFTEEGTLRPSFLMKGFGIHDTRIPADVC